jgi:beta-glucosidase
MGQEDNFIYNYSKAFVDGLQNIKNKKISGAVGSAKHFFGDGSTLYGADQGSADVGSYKKYIDHNIKGYVGSIDSDVGTVMASYSAINYIPMAFGPWLNTLLKTKLDFQGFVISDYD